MKNVTVNINKQVNNVNITHAFIIVLIMVNVYSHLMKISVIVMMDGKDGIVLKKDCSRACTRYNTG